ncbi:Solute carrier family 22 member 7 [Hondaea fermentalgiana]|uniref:Solute carrier family 22 member 7 n=1 Tax=Hondaea fermentalgiana TaxID=2315210 RepID=A0A2R5GAP6_9STRA|nr:Solute carrier family 22 member 7 [Hondaea fermentalgiana]|eukprot:GBG28077.1 Solute carrier family 22 member 7 [Hondaea fermentalgiana]
MHNEDVHLLSREPEQPGRDVGHDVARQGAEGRGESALAVAEIGWHGDEAQGGNGDNGDEEDELVELVDRVGTTPLHWMCVGILGLANAADAVEVLAIGYIVTVFRDPVSGERIDEMPGWSALLTSAVFAGMLIGGLVSGAMGDRFGRKPLLTLSLAVNACAAMVSALTPLLPGRIQIGWLVFFRLIGGLGVGGSVPTVFALASELGPEKTRSLFINVVASFWSAGVMYTSLCAYLFLHGQGGEDRWPYFAAMVALPGTLAACLSLCKLEESPVFLWSNGRSHQAGKVLLRFLESRRDLETAEVETLRDHIEIAAVTCKNGEAERMQMHRISGALALFVNLKKLFEHRSTRRTTMLVSSIYFFLSFAHYGISSWISDLFLKIHFSDPYITSVFYTLATIPGLLGATLLVDRLGRRATTAGAMGLACVSALMFALNTSNRVYVKIFAGLFNCFAACTWNAFDVFSTESFPASLRASGIGLGTACGRVGSVVANVYNGFVLASGASGAGDAAHVATVLLSAAASMLCGAAAAFLLPETLGARTVRIRAARSLDAVQ